jgi:putative inorganic carbon (HCO3(-)) transporter
MPSQGSFPASRLPILLLGGLTIFAPLINGGTTHLPVLIIRLTLLVAVTVWIIASMKSGRITVPWSRLFVPVAIFLGWATLSILWSPYTAISLQWLLSLFSYALMLFLVLQLVDSPWQVRGLVMVILGMGLFEAGVGMYQYLWLGKLRSTGTFFNPNFFATYEVASFAVAFGLLCFREREDGLRWGKPLLWLTAVVGGLAFVLAQSRGGLLAFVAAVAFIGLSRFGKPFLGILMLGFVLGALVPNPLQQRILAVGTNDPYAFTRLDIWKNSLQRIADRPWGVGLGIYKYTSFRYRFPIEGSIARFAKRAESAHNDYLQMAVELGVVGLVMFLVGLGFLGWEIRETLRLGLEPWERGTVIGLSGGILGILTQGAVDSVFHEPAIVLLLCLFAGLILVLRGMRTSGSFSVVEVPLAYRPTRAALIVVLATLLGILVIRPAAAWWAFDAGEHEMTIGRVDRALSWYQLAMRIDPGTSLYHDTLAFAQVRLYQQSGEQRWLYGAVSELKVGLVLNPLDGRLANRLGGTFVLLAGKAATKTEREALLEEASLYYRLAIRLDPYSPFNYLELGKLRWAHGQLDEAQDLFQRVTSYEPNFLPARLSLAELFLKTGQKERAASEYAEILKIKERYQGRAANRLERQYLEVDLEQLRQSLDRVDAS